MGEMELEALDSKLRMILPAEYQDTYEDVQPVSMGSAGLVFDAAGRVAWDEIWGSFCDLAMAGGPPHKGKLLEPASPEEIAAEPVRYKAVVEEICRGIRMVSDLAVEASESAGWVRVMCHVPGMAEWLVRAINMENVSAVLSAGDNCVSLPAGPGYRLEKEIKNVVTSIAKTAHYFESHMASGQHKTIAAVFAAEEPLLQPAVRGHGFADDAVERVRSTVAARLAEATGMARSPIEYYGWIGLECESVRAAIWMMRALVVNGVVARREGSALFVPVHPVADPAGERVVGAVVRARRLAAARGVIGTPQ
jgi:hypothetical protein